MESLVLHRKVSKDKELVEEPKYFIHTPKERTGDDPRFGERRTSSVNKLQISFRTVQRQAQRISEETERSQEQSRKGQLAWTLPTRVHNSQFKTFSLGQYSQYGQNPYGVHSKGAAKD
ncbi:hypothetical protein O181_078123 [Austropuccinia psidii MF-1]|uniref:Uncharacterized protein n=1 Tax=Austropuccinia psidii MF-1 TaxID=1389203 RepID=A0A9Q3FIC4_9BASI|nr:hypothetical protein [Austropuccinia psidii MF-1]